MKILIRDEGGFPRTVVVRIPRDELRGVILSFPYWDAANRGPGVVRYQGEEIRKDTWKAVARYKAFPEEHLRLHGLIDGDGRPLRRSIAIGARNLGNNLGYVAFLHDKGVFYLRDETRLNISSYTCLFRNRDGELGIKPFRFDFEAGRVYLEGDDVTDELEIAISGLPLVREGECVDIRDREFIKRCTDVRHIFYLTREEEARLYETYPDDLDEYVKRVKKLFEEGHVRSWYAHSGVGITKEGDLLILQTAGRLEEVAERARKEGAVEFIVLDNGGSNFLWLPINTERGTLLNCSPKWRRPTIALLAFLLAGELPQAHDGRAP